MGNKNRKVPRAKYVRLYRVHCRIYIVGYMQDMSKVADTRNPVLQRFRQESENYLGFRPATLDSGEPQLVSERYGINPLLSTPTSRCRGVIKTARNRRECYIRRRKVTYHLEASRRTYIYIYTYTNIYDARVGDPQRGVATGDLRVRRGKRLFGLLSINAID